MTISEKKNYAQDPKMRDVDLKKYYRQPIYQHFTKDVKCSVSMTAKVDVTELVKYSRAAGSKFYIDFMYLLAQVFNSREDYRIQYLWPEDKLIVYDKINISHYIFHDDTKTFTIAHTEYTEDYQKFYERCENDVAAAKQTREYGLDEEHYPNYFDASYVSWLSYDALNVELPDGYLYFLPIVNWGRYQEDFRGRLQLPLTVRLNHATADGYLLSQVYLLLAQAVKKFVSTNKKAGGAKNV